MRRLNYLSVLLLAAVSCGKMEVGVEGNGGVGTTRSFVSAAASSTQLAQVQSLCAQLQQKDANFVNFVNGYTRFQYDTSTRACDGSVTTASVAPTLASNGSIFQFVLPPGQALATGVETATSGQLAQLCRAQNNLGYPLEVSASAAIWYRIYTGGDCPSTPSGIQCVQLESGVKQAGGSYKITSTDTFQLRFTTGQDSGMVIRHERIEQGGCAAGKSVRRTAVFTGLN